MQANSLWKNKNFILTFLGALVSNVGAILYSFAVSFYILKITGNNSVIQGIYLAVVGVVSLIVMLFGGVVADKFNKAKIMFICDFLKGGLLAIATGLMFISGDLTYTLVLLFVAGVLGSVFSSFFTPASSALLPLIVPEEKLQQANAANSLLSSVQGILGVVLAGILYSLIPVKILFFIVAACYIASGISEVFIRYEHKKSEQPLTVKNSLTEIGDGFKYMFKKNGLLDLVLAVMFINFFFNPIFSNFIPYFIATDVASSPYLFNEIIQPEMWSSILEVIFSVGMIAGSVIIGMIHYKKASTMSKSGIAILSVLFLGLTLCYFFMVDKNSMVNPFLITLCVLYILAGLILPVVNVPVNTTIQRITEEGMLGKVSAVINVGSQALIPLSSFIAGLVIAGFGVSALLFVCTGGFILTTIVYVLDKRVNEF